MEYIEMIIKYRGDIMALAEQLDAKIEILNSNYAIMTLPLSYIPLLGDFKEIEYYEPPKDVSLIMTESLYHVCIDTNVTSTLSGNGVIIALLDSGIDYTHPDFRNANGTTRILYLWDMTIPGNPPDGFNVGSLYDSDDINLALESGNPFEIVPSVDFIGHGTAVAGVCAGNGAYSGGLERGVAPEASIIAVKLGREGGVHSARTIELMRALKFVSDRSYLLYAPMAINISYGTNQGAHDGQSLFESYIDEVASMTRIAICVASGNEGSAGHHFSGNLATGGREFVRFSVSGGVYTMYMVFWKDFADDFTFELFSPTGRSSGSVHAYDGRKTVILDNTQIFFDMGI
ncbi:MAG: S8 family serine peptidase, partial [Defluviitaleaceae bacterium]|nr:S8 family serine peptidase [Defluviitaleaceae bacterium]